MRYSIEPRDTRYVKDYGFLSIALQSRATAESCSDNLLVQRNLFLYSFMLSNSGCNIWDMKN